MTQPSVRDLPHGVEITGAIATGYDEILTPDTCRLSRNCIARLNRAAANVSNTDKIDNRHSTVASRWIS
jgi:hypothetical protein